MGYFFSKTVSYLKIELFYTKLWVLGKIIICIFEGKYCIFTAIFVWKRTTKIKSLGYIFFICFWGLRSYFLPSFNDLRYM